MTTSNTKFVKSTAALLIGPIMFFAALLLPQGWFDFPARAAIGTVLWMAGWWITRPLHIAVTAMLPIVVNALFDLIPMKQVISQYASEIVVLLLGADLVSITWSETGLDKRLSLKALSLIGPSVKQQIAIWFLVSAGLSAFLPNVMVCAILTPIAISMLTFLGEKDFANSEIAVVILLAIAWGSGIGGCGSPLGGAMNLVAINYIEQFIGQEFMYIAWVKRLMPFLAILVAVNITYLCMIKTNVSHLRGTREFFTKTYRELPAMRRGERISLVLFLMPTLLAFIRPVYSDLLPALKPAYIFLMFGILAFMFYDEEGTTLLDWPAAERGVMWGMLLLFAGGLAAGQLITETGAAATVADLIARFDLNGGLLTIAIFVVFTCLLAEVSSNTAAAAISVPIVLSITQRLGLNPLPYIYITVVAFNSAYVLPLSVRAIPVGYGMDPKALMKHGVVLSMVTMTVITLVGYLFLNYWPQFGSFA
ncbi:MAG TPA: hypothetical protein GX519_02415 [Thermoanaerobacterales bacterium]|nr:hypothetical protein [Thermoanaerobacterales bacterium]